MPLYWRERISGQVLPMPYGLTHSLTTLKCSAFQLLIKYKSGALVTQLWPGVWLFRAHRRWQQGGGVGCKGHQREFCFFYSNWAILWSKLLRPWFACHLSVARLFWIVYPPWCGGRAQPQMGPSTIAEPTRHSEGGNFSFYLKNWRLMQKGAY